MSRMGVISLLNLRCRRLPLLNGDGDSMVLLARFVLLLLLLLLIQPSSALLYQ